MGPSFPAQQPLSEDSVRQRIEGVNLSGVLDWVDWKEQLWEESKAKSREGAPVAGNDD